MRAWKEESQPSLCDFWFSLPNYKLNVRFGEVSSSVPSSFKMVRFLPDAAITIPINILHLGLPLFPPKTSSYRTK